MQLPIIITLIICGTVIIITLIGVLFAAWVINKGAEFAKEKEKH